MEETTMITVSIAKLGTSIQQVTLAYGATVMSALRKADYNLDEVQSVKRNGTVVAMDTVLGDGEVILVSIGKIKGGNDTEATEEGNVVRLAFTIEKANAVAPDGLMAFLDSQSTFDIVKNVMHSRGVSMNYFKEIRKEDGTLLTLADKLVDGEKYKIIICELENCEDDE